jgi:apolipoprotein N-acyltransferase
MPLRTLMPAAINNLVSSDLKAGRDPVLFQLSAKITAAPLVCFEDTLSDLTRRDCLAGAQILVNLTNDGWFQKTAGAEQHLANATFRAVENRRPLVRSTNTGLTGVVDTMGRWQQWIEPFTENVAIGKIDVPTSGALTFYTRHGDWFAYLSTGLSLAWLAVRIRRRWRSHRREGLRSTGPLPQ